MKKTFFAFSLILSLFVLTSAFADDSDDDFLNMIEETLSENSVQENSADSVEVVLEDSAEAVSEDFSSGEAEESVAQDKTETELETSEIVQSLYGIPEKKPDSDDEYGDDFSNIKVTIPEKRKPKKADSEKLELAEKKDEDKSDLEKKTETLNFGTPTEIQGVVDKVVEDDDPRFIDTLYELFYATSSNDVRSKILDYFAKNEDPCLCDYVVEVLDDPYDESKNFVSKCMDYASKVNCREAAPALVKILESDNEDYFNAALSALGKTGGKKEAKYLAKYLERDDLEVPMRQALMRTLGQMNAGETWEQIVKIAQDEDENGFVRQYAAEALGNMKNEDSIPILINLYENGDPNMREYCIKGLLNFPDSKKAIDTVIQSIRDDHVKVRLQSIKAVREMKLGSAVKYLIYRAKNDNETAVKKACYPVIAELDTKEGNDFLISQLEDKKTPDSAKNMAAEAILKYSKKEFGVKEIKELALSVVEDDRRKSLRTALGKIIAKNPRDDFDEVCIKYLESKVADVTGLGIDMYMSGRYKSAVGALTTLAEGKNGNLANRKRARKLLGMEENPEENKSDKTDKKENGLPNN